MKDRITPVRQLVSIFCIALLLQFSASAPLAAQQQPAPPPSPQLSPDQLDNLVAPIALYPDALLSEVLVASTYPLEVVEAGQWLQQNRSIQGSQLVDAARQQNWDPSIQALVVFPDVLGRLNSDVRWTEDLGNAFLAQQADVMNAVQRLRAQARAAGKLNSNTQETIATDTQAGQTAIEIQPANPEVVYVPDYNPVDIWGPPAYGYYPPLAYPDYFGFGWGPGIYIGGFFGGLGWGGWGWGPNWFNCSIFENGFFFNHYGYRGFHGYGGGFGGRGLWAHNPEHRMGVAYSNQAVANRFGGNFGGRGRLGGAGSGFAANRMNGGGNAGFANRGNFGSGAVRQGSQFGGNRLQTPQGASSARAGQWNRFGSSGSRQNFRGNSTYGGSSAYRSSPSFSGNYGGVRNMPAYRSTPSFSGNNFRSTPSFGGNNVRSAPSFGGGFRSTPSFGGGRSAGGSFHSFGGGGGSFHSGGGGGFHGGGGGYHGGGGGGHAGGGRR
jgi:Protein of unknown function (DUF3300)